MALWDMCQVYFKIDEAFVSSLEEIFHVFGLLDEGFEIDECSIDLIFIELNESDSLLFLSEMQFGPLDDVLIMGQVFLEGLFLLSYFLDVLRFLLDLSLVNGCLLFDNLLNLFAHRC
jgi:hypothetical protein